MADTNAQSQPTAAPAAEAKPLDAMLAGQVQDFRGKVKTTFKDPATQTEVEKSILAFCSQILDRTNLVSDEALETLDAFIAALDAKLTEQVNLIIHHPVFQKLEGSWRGLEHMVFGTETSTDLKIRVLNITKDEIGKVFKRFKGAKWDQSPLFQKIYGQEYDMAGGQPYGVLIGDYTFDKSAPDVDILKGMGQIAAAAHAPFISGTAPGLLGMDSWLELPKPPDLKKIFEGPEYAAWRGFRQSEDSRYVALTMPRFLSRLPYGKDNPVDGFNFVEQCEGGDHSKYTWANAAYAMGANITQSFKYYGWCSCIRGKNAGGEVTGMNCHTFPTDDGGLDMKCPTEIAIGDRRERELMDCGLNAILHWKNTDTAAFLAATSLYQPKEYTDPDATANSKLNGALPYLFAVSRFAHFLKVMVRDAIGLFKEREDMENWLQNWIANYVTTDPKASQEVKARYPLAAAQVQVEDVPGNPGWYKASFWLRPHYQLEGLETSLRLVTKLPAQKAAG